MISLEKGMMLTPLQKLPSNVGDLGKIIVATGFEWLPKVQKISQSVHTASKQASMVEDIRLLLLLYSTLFLERLLGGSFCVISQRAQSVALRSFIKNEI